MAISVAACDSICAVTSYEGSYIARLRKVVGHALVVSPGAQVLAVRSDGHVLLQRRSDSGVWEIPAGACEPGRSFRDTAVDEFREEVGIQLEPADLVPFASLSDPGVHTLHYPNGDAVHAFALCFSVAVEETDVVESSTDGEAVAWGWFAPRQPPSPLHGPTEAVLALYLRFLASGQFQAH